MVDARIITGKCHKELFIDDEVAFQFLIIHGVLPCEVQFPDCKLPCTLYVKRKHAFLVLRPADEDSQDYEKAV